jgi:hypothetical protein
MPGSIVKIGTRTGRNPMPIARHFELGFGKAKVALAVSAMGGGSKLAVKHLIFQWFCWTFEVPSESQSQTHPVDRN